jgi:hypothetical protein
MPETGVFCPEASPFSVWPAGSRSGHSRQINDLTRLFVVNHGNQSTDSTGPVTLVPIEIDDEGGCLW